MWGKYEQAARLDPPTPAHAASPVEAGASLLHPGGYSWGLSRSPLAPLPKEKALLFWVQGSLDSMVWMKAEVLESSAELTGRFGRSKGPGGHVVLVAATHGARGHAETLLGARVERKHLCCSSAAAALQIDTSMSICTDPFQPSLFAL